MKELVISLLKSLNFFFPKKGKRILFKSRPDLSGNSKALSDFLIQNEYDYELIWAVDTLPEEINDKVKYVRFKSAKFYFYYFTSSFIVTTHNEIISPIVSRQKYLSLWHGMPFKKICYLSDSESKGMKDYSVFRIATSEITRSIISASFREKANRVVITGQPRNDFLFIKNEMVSTNFETSNYKKIISFIPTFRENLLSDNNVDGRYSDGEKITDRNFFRTKDFDLAALNQFLSKNNYLLLIKLHPFEEKVLKEEFFGTNIKVIDSNFMVRNHLDVNHLLAFTDILISDYSSIFFDFLILDKPIIFLTPDLDSYSKSRGGFTLEPFDFWTPGKKVITQTELCIELEKLDSDTDDFAQSRKLVSQLINKYSDDLNSERVYQSFLK